MEQSGLEGLNPQEHQEHKDNVDGYGYKLIGLSDDVPKGAEEQIISNKHIGCPDCNDENRYANFTGGGSYQCPVCGYTNELNIATLLNP